MARSHLVRVLLPGAIMLAFLAPGSSAALASSEPLGRARAAAESPPWEWPVRPVRVVVPYLAPAHRYGPGHRGIDLESTLSAPVDAPADGVIAFSGRVVDRDLVTIDHGSGLVTTLEPVLGEVAVGGRVRRGDRVGIVGLGGHAAPGTLHIGVRLHGEYLNPLVLLGSLPRAVLLPCCE